MSRLLPENHPLHSFPFMRTTLVGEVVESVEQKFVQEPQEKMVSPQTTTIKKIRRGKKNLISDLQESVKPNVE